MERGPVLPVDTEPRGERAAGALERGLSAFQEHLGRGAMSVAAEAIDRSIVNGETGTALLRIMDAYRAERMPDGKLIALYQRAICGWVLDAGRVIGDDRRTVPLPISVEPPTDAPLRRALRVLAMVGELHKAGYQRLRIAAGMSPSGAYWRCHITASTNVRPNGWEPTDWEDGVASYTSGQEDRYFGWDDAPGKTARQLAAMFVERFPAVASAGAGRDIAYAGWYVGMLGIAESGRLPIFFADWELDDAQWDNPPAP